MDESRFDEFARTLSSGVDRRRVLGGALTSVLAGVLGAPGSEARRKHGTARTDRKRRGRLRAEQAAGERCKTFCLNVPPGPARGKCQQECVHGTGEGLFDQCEGEITKLCTDAAGLTNCCAANEACVINAATGTGSCEVDACPVATTCGNPFFCPDAPACFCVETTEGGNACVLGGVPSGGLITCDDSNFCTQDQRCIKNTCFGSVCADECSSNQARSSGGEDGRRLFDDTAS